jgi:hypothetical protein
MKRVAPIGGAVPLHIALANDFRRNHEVCTIVPSEKTAEVLSKQNGGGDDQVDEQDAIIEQQAMLHSAMISDFDRAHEEFMQSLEDDMAVTYTISRIFDYHEFMTNRFDEYQKQFLALCEDEDEVIKTKRTCGNSSCDDSLCDEGDSEDDNVHSDETTTNAGEKKKKKCNDEYGSDERPVKKKIRTLS